MANQQQALWASKLQPTLPRHMEVEMDVYDIPEVTPASPPPPARPPPPATEKAGTAQAVTFSADTATVSVKSESTYRLAMNEL